MTISPAGVLQTLLANPRDLANVKSVTTPEVTYVSLSEDNPELKRYLPWTGTSKGPEAIVRTFEGDRKSTRLNSSHVEISYAVFCLKKKKIKYSSNHIIINKIHA